jgi:predicted amidohydrolase
MARAPSLTLGVAQPALSSLDVAENARVHAEAVRSAEARVVAFPELSLTGYELDARAIATTDPRLRPIVEACAETGSIALVGAPVAGDGQGEGDGDGDGDGDEIFIGLLAIDGNGVSVAYRKMWLGAEESRRFTPGPAPAVLEVDGWRLGLAICRDTGIAQHASDTAGLGMDAYLAGTVKAADESTLLHEWGRRIAAEHGVWVAIASFAGSTGGGYAATAGGSAIWAPGGVPICVLDAEPGRIGRATLGRA